MKIALRVLFVLLGLFSAAIAAVYVYIWTSTPRVGRDIRLAGLSGKVVISEDAFGVPTIHGDSILDVLRAQGWITARERLFQMDLIRRRSSGRLAEILGPALVQQDKLRHTYGFPQVAARAAQAMSPQTRALIDAYAAGVNEYIQSGPRPLEMKVLGYHPYPWTAEDTIEVVLSMFDPGDLIPNEEERVLTHLYATYPRTLIDFLTPESGFLDAPILGADPVADSRAVPRLSPHPSEGFASPFADERSLPGSNAWAIAASRSASGAPILAGDPHLGLNVPSVWFRVRLEAPDLAVTGVSLPGLPLVMIGTNGNVAWSFTNGMIDSLDSVPLVLTDPGHYRSAGGDVAFTVRHESIAVRGAAPVTFDVRETTWGPVFESPDGKAFALQWTALDSKPLADPEILGLCQSKDLASAFEALSHWGGPVHHAILATRDGHIGWTMVGNIPRRVGFDGRISVPRDASHYWKGYIPFAELPHKIDPTEGFLSSSNQRSVPASPAMYQYGNHWPEPARAYRIRELLAKRGDWTADAQPAIQNDIYSHTHVWYRDLLVQCARKTPSTDARLAEAVELVKGWDGRIEKTSSAYPFLKAFRTRLFRDFLFGQLKDLRPFDREGAEDLVSRDPAIVRLAAKQNPEFCPGVNAAAIAVANELAPAPAKLSSVTWGPRNHSRIRHPFSYFLPGFLARFFNMPEVELAGDLLVPPANEPSHGASMRMVVDLADRTRSLFAQPGGQSGHVLSRNFADQFGTWSRAQTTAFEPGAPRVSWALLPKN